MNEFTSSAAVMLSNALTIGVVVAALWFARAGFMREQKKILESVDDFKKMFERWEEWRVDHETREGERAKTLVRAYDVTITHTSQISELDRRVTRWENRELDRAGEKKN